MQIYDILMAIILIATMLIGAIKGFAWQLASIGSIVVSYAVAMNYREPFSRNIHLDPPWSGFLAMLILYVGTSLAIWTLFGMAGKVIDRMKLKEFDHHIGALFGLLKGSLYCTLVTMAAVTLMGETVRTAVISSRSGHWIARTLDQADIVMPEELHSIVRPVIDQFHQPESATSTLPQAEWFSAHNNVATSADY